MIKISTSILSKISKEVVLKLNKTDTDFIHLDIMDGLFVNNKAFSVDEIKMIASYSKKPLDVHLMVNDLDYYINHLSKLSVSYITFHYEVLKGKSDIEKVKQHGIKCGLSLKPKTKIESIFPYLNQIDLVLIMSVEPGYGGQGFIDDSLNRITRLKREIAAKNLNIVIAVDGGINQRTAKKCIERGADMLIAGSFIVKAKDYQQQINLLRQTSKPKNNKIN